MILNKRLKRDFLNNKVKNIAMIAIIAFSMMLIVSLCSSSDAIKAGIENMWEICNIEHGSFDTYAPLSTRNFDELSEINVFVEPAFYSDVETENDGKLRLFKNRKYINLIYPETGNPPLKKGDLFIEKIYARNHNLSVGDRVYLGGVYYNVCGIGCIPDYSYVKQNSSDVAPNDEFGVGAVTDYDFSHLPGSGKLIYHYSFILGEDCTMRDLKEKLNHMKFDASSVKDTYMRALIAAGKSTDGVNVSAFEDARYNIRIHDAIDDSEISKQSALIAGVILSILLVYILAIFASGTIERERGIIGTLYALGYTKKEILSHYMKMPQLIAFSGALAGLIGGFMLTDSMASSYVAMYSIPDIVHVYPLYLICYAIGVPTLFSYFINYFVLSKKLNGTPLSMMRKSHSAGKRKGIKLKNLSFETKFRIRQFIREIRGNITLFAGVIISLLLMMFSFACYSSIKNYIDGVAEDIHYNYMYILRNPVTDLEKNKDVGYTRGFYVDFPLSNTEMEVTLLGIDYDNPYFDFSPELEDDPNKIYMSSSARIKFGYKTGDKVVFSDKSADRTYAFEIAGEYKFASGLYFFMNINAMREAFGLEFFDPEDLELGERRPKNEDFYYNTVFSDDKLEFKHNMLISETVKSDMKKGADKFMTLMWDMIIMLVGVSVIIFAAIMYLLMKLEIDRSSSSVSILKALGYEKREVHSFYLGNSFFVTAAATIVGLPLLKKVVDMVYPFAVSNVNGGFEAVITPLQYLCIVIIIFLSWLMTRILLDRYLSKISLAEILKDRE